MLYLGAMYESGKGAEKNSDTAFGWFKQAHRKNPDEILKRASNFRTGSGGAKISDQDAALWHEIAVRLGDNRALYPLAQLYDAKNLSNPNYAALSLLHTYQSDDRRANFQLLNTP